MATKAPRRHVLPREPLCPSLPAEIWINIFTYYTDLAHLWNTVRRVSSVLRACVDRAFADHFLHQMHIDFALEKYNLGGRSKRPELRTRFSRRSRGTDDDGGDVELAWFKDERPDPPESSSSSSSGENTATTAAQMKRAQEQYKTVTQRWIEHVESWKPEMPRYTITLGAVVNDTPLVHLAISAPTREISFDWKASLELFFREQARMEVLKCRFEEQMKGKMEEVEERVQRGEKLVPGDYPEKWENVESAVRRGVRRKRLKGWYEGDEEMVWAIESLACFEQGGGSAEGESATRRGSHHNQSSRDLILNPDLPGARLGEKWYGKVYLVQELYLDEWSCLHRIDLKEDQMGI